MSKYKLIRIITSLLILLFVTSCDKFQWASIVNNSSNNITIIIKYNKNLSEENKSKLKTKIDTIILKSTEEYTFNGNIRAKPNFDSIDEITILSKDTILLKSKRIFMDELFSLDEEKGIYQLNIE